MPQETAPVAARDEIAALYPWASTLGLIDLISGLVAADASADEVIATVRGSEPYRAQFPGMIGPDGTRRYATERAYLDQVQGYRDVLQEAGWYDERTDSPQDYVAFMEGGIDPNELRERAVVYQQLESGSQELRDAFYVYGGMDVTVDDLFQAVVAPEFGQRLQDEYNRQVTGTTLDYETYISRATERGLDNVADLLGTMAGQGLITSEAVARIQELDPSFAREVMGAIANEGDRTLNLHELSYAFQYALLGSAATEAGLEAPTREMVEKLRSAGVERARAAQVYGQYSTGVEALRGMTQRAGMADITQAQFAEAGLLNEAESVDLVERARGLEAQLGRRAGGFQTGQQGGRITQRGRRGQYSGY